MLNESLLLDMPVDAPTSLHRTLALHIRDRLAPRASPTTHPSAARTAVALQRMLEMERQAVAVEALDAPVHATGFLAWFASLAHIGPGQSDALFPWLAYEADETAMRWFLEQELAGEAGFDDLIAMTMVRMPPQAKMEMARNLWDEFGRGNPAGTHSSLLAATARILGLEHRSDAAVWEALALGNMMAGMAIERMAFHAVGALGVIELTAPGRVAKVASGMRRLGMPAEARRYFEVHAAIDVEHSRRWNAEVIQPLVEQNPGAVHLIAEGALMRLNAGARCYVRYRHELLGD